MKKALILDLDNTLYNWMDAYSISFNNQVEYLCKTLGIERKVILSEFKIVFQKYYSVEIPNAVNKLRVWENCNLSKIEIEKIQSRSIVIFFQSWKENITLFPGVEETIIWAKSLDYLIFAYSDAFAFWIDFRLEILNLQKYFDKIFAMTNESISDFDLIENSNKNKLIYPVLKSEMKPNTFILSKILNDYGIDKKNAYFIGDSITKDIETAREIGIHDVWARYGLNYKKESGELLSQVTPWKKKTGGIYELQKRTIPTYTIQNFSEIKKIINNS